MRFESSPGHVFKRKRFNAKEYADFRRAVQQQMTATKRIPIRDYDKEGAAFSALY